MFQWRHLPGGPAHDLCHPVPLCAVVVLVVNDHWWKVAGVLPAAFTGKISDVAGLFFFPLVLAAVARSAMAVTGHGGARAELVVAAGSALATASVFSLLKLHPGFNDWAASVWSQNVMDVTDLWTLPSTGLSFGWMRWRAQVVRRRPAPTRMVAQITAIAAAALASIATSAPLYDYPRNYPAWKITEHGSRDIGCADLVAWFSKSGKEGVGLSLGFGDAKTPLMRCEVRVVAAQLVIGEARIPAVKLPLPARGDVDYLYVAFGFDNEAKWNADERRGRFELALEVNGTRVEWRLPAVHSRSGPHRKIPRGAGGSMRPVDSSSTSAPKLPVSFVWSR